MNILRTIAIGTAVILTLLAFYLNETMLSEIPITNPYLRLLAIISLIWITAIELEPFVMFAKKINS
ncbi:hypothetical protein J4219_03780 [Candidatus Woesearchaeota archaeon]|nr:hypothetical protein [Candidatus Woesearchaeota archaeon]